MTNDARRALAAHLEFMCHMVGHLIDHVEDIAAELEMDASAAGWPPVPEAGPTPRRIVGPVLD